MKNGAPHGNTVNSSKIEGSAPRKSRKKRPETEGTTAETRRRKIMDPVSILAPFWEALGNHFGSQNDSKNRVKFRGRFFEGKKTEKGGQKTLRGFGLIQG